MVHIRHCFYCGKALSRRTGGKDHIIPRSKGGSDSHKNIVDACRKCNTEKGNLLLDEYRQVVAYRLGVDPINYEFPGELLYTSAVSEETYQQQLTRQKDKRAERKAAGLCMRCGSLPVKPDCVNCKSCASIANQYRAKKKAAGVCAYCSDQKPVIPGTGWCQACYENSKQGKKAREKHRKNKTTCFDHYGRVCSCCDLEFDERFLTLDGNNDENEDRNEFGSSTIYSWAIKTGFPNILQTQCFNCTMGKSVNGGVCPHKDV